MSSHTCPNCGRRLMGVPGSVKRLDMSCTSCGFRFQTLNGRALAVAPAARVRANDRDASRSTMWAFMIGAVATMTIAFLVGVLDGDMIVALVLAIGGGVVCAIILKRQMTPEVPVRYYPTDSRAAFATTERLKGTREKLLTSRNGHATGLGKRNDLRRRLAALQAKMRDLGLAAYAPRITSIDTAITMLDRQIEMDRRLCDGYDRSIKMVDIELEAGAMAEEINVDVAAALEEAMVELQALEESQAELSRQLAANVEVELLLRR